MNLFGTMSLSRRPLLFGSVGAAVPVVPAAPTLTVTAGNAQNTLSWTDGSNGGAAITAHKIYRGTSSGGETYLGQTSSASPYVDTGLTNGTTYYYKLSAVNSVGEGALSTEQSGTPAGSVAAALKFNLASNSQYVALRA